MTDQELKALFEDDASAAVQDAHVPAAGYVWWRAAMRSRAEAARAAERPLAWSQGVAAACAVGMMAAAGGAFWSFAGEIAVLAGTSARWMLPFGVAVATGIALLPLALYVALSDD
jgi:hypothetical protein